MVEVSLHDSRVVPIPIIRRFITPIFVHAGFVHIALNMMAQLTAGAQVRAVTQTCRIIDRPVRFRLKERWGLVASSFCILPQEFLGKMNYLLFLFTLTTFQQCPRRQLCPRGCALYGC